MKIKVVKDPYSCNCFEGEEYTVDLDRKIGEHTPGDLVCYVSPFGYSLPLELRISIRADGSIAFRSWAFTKTANPYLQTMEKSAEALKGDLFSQPFTPTPEQIDTVNGLFSGRIKFEGLKLAVGQSVQLICPVDVRREEELTGRTIYLA